MTDDLVTWLRAQLDDDERDARAADRVATNGHVLMLVDRTLAEVDAKRRILDLHTPTNDVFYGSPLCVTCDPQAWPCPTVRLLALPYADRPGYREEWKPQ